MISDRIYYLRIQAAQGRLEEALRLFVAPVLRNVPSNPAVDAGFFSRYQMEALLFIVGDPLGLSDIRKDVEQCVERLLQTGLLRRRIPAAYRPEYERYGGEEGMRLAERIFQADSLSCLELLDVEYRGLLGRSRREYSLLLTERLLDLLGFDRAQKIAFYKYSYAWAIDRGQWQQPDMLLLEERYEDLKDGLAGLFDDQLPDEDLFGGAEAARVAHGWIERTRPLIAELQRARSAGRVSQDVVPLAWSYTHMQCNRLGITGEAEAILRFFMQRLHEARSGGAS